MATCYALESFCEHLQGEEILPYAEPLISKLLQLLQEPSSGTDPSKQREVQEIAISALSSTAAAAGQVIYLSVLLPSIL